MQGTREEEDRGLKFRVGWTIYVTPQNVEFKEKMRVSWFQCKEKLYRNKIFASRTFLHFFYTIT